MEYKALTGGTVSNVITFLAKADVEQFDAHKAICNRVLSILSMAGICFTLLAITAPKRDEFAAAGVAAALAPKVLGSAVAALPAIVFSIWMNFSGSVLASIWSRRHRQPMKNLQANAIGM